MRLALALVLLGLAACGPDDGDGLTEVGVERCMARSGTVIASTETAGLACEMPSTDAGKACTVASDCSGFCDPDTFTCSAELSRAGCYSFLDDDGEEQAICVE